jgi:uncharacterized RDD family membrane protein YckC
MQPNPGANPEFSPSGAAPGATGSAYSVDNALAVRQEEKTNRVIGFLIDLIPAFFLGWINVLPILGWMIHGFLSACYWLFRDITGSSIGKMVMGSVVVREDGTPASVSQKILRNLPLALPGFIGVIPFIGIFFEIILGALILGIEIILLLSTGRRLGDRLAGTTVVRKRSRS